MVRPGRAAAPAARQHRGAAAGDRADRPGDAAALRALVARDRPLPARPFLGRQRTGRRGDLEQDAQARRPQLVTRTPRARCRGGGPTACARCSRRSRASRCRREVWERDVLPRRLGRYDRGWLDRLCSAGEVVWAGAGAGGGRGGRVALYFREDAPFLGPPPVTCRRGPARQRSTRRCASGSPAAPRSGPTCWPTSTGSPARRARGALGPGLGGRGDQRRLRAAARAAPVAAPPPVAAPAAAAGSARAAPARSRSVQGRWSLTRAAVRAARRARRSAPRRAPSCCSSATGSSHARPSSAERVPGGFASLYAELSALETLGSARRGYFVEGLGGAQFALAAAVERLRTHREAHEETVVLAAQDPANLYGAALPWPRRDWERWQAAPARAGAGRATSCCWRASRPLRGSRRPRPGVAAPTDQTSGCGRRSRRSPTSCGPAALQARWRSSASTASR